MPTEEYKLLIVLALGIALLAAVGALKYTFLYAGSIRRVKMEIRRACTRQERDQWRRELLILRLSILPGVSLKWARWMGRKAYQNKM